MQVEFELELVLPPADLAEEEAEFLQSFEAAKTEQEIESGRLVLVAISSSFNGLFSVQWGEVELQPTRTLAWTGFHESLLALQPSLPVTTSSARTFRDGAVPSKFPQPEVGEVTDSNDE